MSFLQRVTTALSGTPNVLVIAVPPKWGTPYLFKDLTERKALCVWLHLTSEDADDPVAQGNKLADAVTRALGSPLFGHAMPYGYGLSVLRQHLALFEPLTLLLSGAEHGLALAKELTDLHRPGTQVVLAFETLPPEVSLEAITVLTETDLQLQQDEALELAQERLEPAEVAELLEQSGGAVETFLLKLHERLLLPPHLRPTPDGGEPPPEAQPSIDPAMLLGVLERQEKYVEALEVACDHAPERVPALLQKAGEAYLERGLYKRLWGLLDTLSPELQKDETVLTWRLRSGRRLGRIPKLRSQVEAHLLEHDAPDLRAYYATILGGKRGFLEAAQAYSLAKTPVTLHHYGLALSFHAPEQSLAVFKELVELTERQGTPWHRVQAFALLAFALVGLGRFREGVAWLERGITSFDEHGIGDWQARLNMVNNWAYARILIGETVGLYDLLQGEAQALHNDHPTRTVSFRSTLGDYLLSQGRAKEALPHFEENVQIYEAAANTRLAELPPNVVRDAVHALLHAGDSDQASLLARKHFYLTREAQGLERTYATLAHGMALAVLNPAEAMEPLKEASFTLDEADISDHFVSAQLYLAGAQLALGDEEAAAATVTRCKERLSELSETGFRLLAPPEAHARALWALWREDAAPLHLEFLGQREVRLNGERLELYPQWLDILTLLALYPNGLSAERLLTLLYGDAGKVSSLKATLSKLRKHVPLTRAPYRLDVAWQADFVDLEQALREGRLRSGLELYKGALLPSSDAPGVSEARETLEEGLRQAVLTSGDAEALISLSEHLGDDLELWEAALDALPKQDPRHSLAAAKHKQVLESW